MAPRLPEVFHGRRRREELVTQALVATHLFHRDTAYLVRDEKVQIIDESTGRILPDRSWERGLHQMIEAKEGVPLTGQQTSLARMTYQRFFRRYLWLAGMTGTAQEVTAELWSVYGLPVVPVPTHRPVRRANLGVAAYATADEKWAAVIRRVKELGATGRPVLIGTRAVGASEHLSTMLAAAGIRHEVLNARQDEREAEIVAQAGQRGAVMVATNMAGRGTDIKLGNGVDALGGLHVIATEFHEAGRIDRQLFGRSGRQGDPGSFESIVSLEDEVMRLFGGVLSLALARVLIGTGRGRGALVTALFRRAQRRGEAYQAAIRRDLLSTDERMGDLLAFSGKGE